MPSITNTQRMKPIAIGEGTRHLILCEGSDDEQFIYCYLHSSAFINYDVKDVQLMQTSGKDNLRPRMKSLRNQENFSQLRSLLVIRDTDNSIRSAQDSVKGAFQAINLPVPEAEHKWNSSGPVKTGFVLLPSCGNKSQTGALEDLCWKTLTTKHGPSIREEVSRFIESLEQSGKRTYSHRNKALIHTYFSATDDLIAASIGRAAEAGAFDWLSPELNSLHSFLISMVNGQ